METPQTKARDVNHNHNHAAASLMIVLSAPSGAGKTTLAHRLLREFPAAHFSVSYTTRAPRGAEVDGSDYHFVSSSAFRQMIDRDEFVEWASVHGNFYGSSRLVIDRAKASGGLAVFDIDVQGGATIKRKFPETLLIFVLPPSLGELERRLRGRGTDSDDVISNRLLAARAEIDRGVESYDYLVVNDDLELAWSQLRSIVIAERCRRGRVDLGAFRSEGLKNTQGIAPSGSSAGTQRES